MEVCRKASKCIFSPANMIIFKSYLDLDLSESDWSRFVVQFGLSDLNEKRFEPAFVRFMVKRFVARVLTSATNLVTIVRTNAGSIRNVSPSNHSAKTLLRTCTSLTQTGAGLSMIWKYSCSQRKMYNSMRYSFWHIQEPRTAALKFSWRHKQHPPDSGRKSD